MIRSSATRLHAASIEWRLQFMGSVVSVKPIGRFEGRAAGFGNAKNISLSLHDFIYIAVNEKIGLAEPRGRRECVYFTGKTIC